MTDEQFVMTCVYVLTGILGLCVGSFLNVVIYRVPLGMSLSKPSSHCPRCGYSLSWFDNVPLFSYLFLGGKCRKCKARISPRYVLVEIFNALLWLLCVFLFWEKSIVYSILCMLSLSTLICIFFIDLEHMLIFNRFTLLIFLSGLLAIFFDPSTKALDHVIGALAAGALFLAIYYLAIWVLGKEGLGFGDVKLSFAAGLLLGWQKMLLALLIASVTASILLIILRKQRGDDVDKEYPFGPFLAAGFAIALLCGDPVISYYLSLFSF
ncbi:MAG: prepilin peptidase [Clostridia bacterium]|nr:prepilin peptidase [Clostridia bacterium]MBQ8269513.1 prepilin peptidase [Clostridia bacterium]